MYSHLIDDFTNKSLLISVVWNLWARNAPKDTRRNITEIILLSYIFKLKQMYC